MRIMQSPQKSFCQPSLAPTPRARPLSLLSPPPIPFVAAPLLVSFRVVRCPVLGSPHHAGYVTHGFSNLVVFDRHRLFQEAEQMPALDLSLWKSVASHCLRYRTLRGLCTVLCHCVRYSTVQCCAVYDGGIPAFFLTYSHCMQHCSTALPAFVLREERRHLRFFLSFTRGVRCAWQN